jgi:hypothetical protein
MTNLTKILRDLVTDVQRTASGAAEKKADAESKLVRLRALMAERRAELERMRRAPLPIEEILADRIPRVVAEHARLWVDRHEHALLYDDYALGSPSAHGSRRLPWRHDDPIPWGVLCLASPQLAQDLLANAVRALSYPPGPPSADRPDLIAKLKAELDGLERVEEQVVDSLIAAGVQVAHREEVRARREAEAAERARQEQAVADRARREAELNRLHEERRTAGRVARSPYIEGRD